MWKCYEYTFLQFLAIVDCPLYLHSMAFRLCTNNKQKYNPRISVSHDSISLLNQRSFSTFFTLILMSLKYIQGYRSPIISNIFRGKSKNFSFFASGFSRRKHVCQSVDLKIRSTPIPVPLPTCKLTKSRKSLLYFFLKF